MDSPANGSPAESDAGIASSPMVAVSLRAFGVRVAGRELLRDVTLEIPTGKITVLVGPSGAGKSILLRVLGGLVDLDDPAICQSGEIVMTPQPSDDPKPAQSGLSGEETPPPRSSPPRVGIVFQNFALFDQWSPLDNVRLAVDHRADRSQPPEQSAAGWLEELGVPAQTAVGVLSGGQKQRLAIARTLAADPAVILYDEPTSGLDSASGKRVAELIRRTQRAHRRTAIIVTHDYTTLLGIADQVLLLDPETKSLTAVAPERWPLLAESIHPLPQPRELASPAAAGVLARVEAGFTRLGRVVARGSLPEGMPRRDVRPAWVSRFFTHYLRAVCGPSAIVYLAVAGALLGFTATYFTIQFLPYRIYTKPLLLEDLLGAIGFALYRILVPVLATILVAARCGAAVAADVGVKRYGSQLEALRTLGISPAVYVMLPILLAFVLGTPLLTAIAFQVARGVSVFCFSGMHPELGPYFWHPHFHHAIGGQGLGIFDGWFAVGWLDTGWRWVLLKTVLCGAGIGLISYYRGSRPQRSASDVSNSITATVLWATLFVLIVHFAISLVEFRNPV